MGLYVSKWAPEQGPTCFLLSWPMLSSPPSEAYYRLERFPQSACTEAQQVGDEI